MGRCKEGNEEILKATIEEVYRHTGISATAPTSERAVANVRSMYYSIVRKLYPEITLVEMAKSVDRHHASVIHGLKMYNSVEFYNPEFKRIKEDIIQSIRSNSVIGNIPPSVEVPYLRREIRTLTEYMQEFKRNFSIEGAPSVITDIVKLLGTADVTKKDLIVERLEAFYVMNK